MDETSDFQGLSAIVVINRFTQFSRTGYNSTIWQDV
tara:strand:+ start:191 stop:298 length:108 start_codon:yes stop_codon:yes gene_type:complete